MYASSFALTVNSIYENIAEFMDKSTDFQTHV